MKRVRPFVAAALRFYKTPLDRLLVVHDEVDLEFGRLQASSEVGSGTTGCARRGQLRGRRTSCGSGSESAGPSAAIRGPWPTTSVAVRADLDVGRDRGPATDAVETLVTEGLEITMTRYNERDPEP